MKLDLQGKGQKGRIGKEKGEMEWVMARQYFWQFYANADHPENDEQQNGQ